MSNVPNVNITIRSMNGKYSTQGLELDGEDILALKLKPGEVVSIPSDHPIFDLDGTRHLELTRNSPTRPMYFPTPEAAAEYKAGNAEHLVELQSNAYRIQASLQNTQTLREENKRRRDEMIEKGEYVASTEVFPGYEGARNNNAGVRGDEPVIAEPLSARAPRKRRGKVS